MYKEEPCPPAADAMPREHWTGRAKRHTYVLRKPELAIRSELGPGKHTVCHLDGTAPECLGIVALHILAGVQAETKVTRT